MPVRESGSDPFVNTGRTQVRYPSWISMETIHLPLIIGTDEDGIFIGIPFRIKNPAKEAPLFSPPAAWNIRRTNSSEKMFGCFGFSQHKQRASRTCSAVRDRVGVKREMGLIPFRITDPAKDAPLFSPSAG